MKEAREARERAVTLADAERAIPEGLPEGARNILLGLGCAGAAIAVHPTLRAPQQGVMVQINPSVWPLGFTLQGAFF
jgi:hypothetical protein